MTSVAPHHFTRPELALDSLLELTGGELQTNPVTHRGSITLVDALPPNEAQDGHVTMIDGSRGELTLAETKARVVLTAAFIDPPENGKAGPPIQVRVNDVHGAFAKVVTHFRPPIDDLVPPSGIDSTARIHPSAHVHSSAVIGPHVTIGRRVVIHSGVTIAGRCQIDDDCVLHPGVCLYPYSRLHARVILHAATVIGANGFGYKLVDGRHVPSAQLGFVEIESDVEVGASVTIDRGSYGATRIGEGTKIDNQVMIAHNCQIGKHNLLCSQVGIAGSCQTGDYVVLAGQVGLKDHVRLGDRSIVAAQAGVMDDLPGDQVYLGSPAMGQREQMQVFAVQRRLPEMRRQLRKLEKQIAALEHSNESEKDVEPDSKPVADEMLSTLDQTSSRAA
ncbi:MAG: UDP-3-O-(3-hydroxymyristoyl)glucosamine N-acyltransferase [Planctomycetota bacterium]